MWCVVCGVWCVWWWWCVVVVCGVWCVVCGVWCVVCGVWCVVCGVWCVCVVCVWCVWCVCGVCVVCMWCVCVCGVCVVENVTLRSVFLSKTFTSVNMSVASLRTQLTETQQREQGSYNHVCPSPSKLPGCPDCHCLRSSPVGHFHMARTNHKCKKHQIAEIEINTSSSTTSRDWLVVAAQSPSSVVDGCPTSTHQMDVFNIGISRNLDHLDLFISNDLLDPHALQ